DLCKALPAGVAFIDLLRYVRFEQDPRVKGEKGEKRVPCYMAFVLTREAVKRVELNEAKEVEELLRIWRRAVVEGSSTEPDYAAKMHARVWAPLARHLPAKAPLVYVCPDAALHGLPWAALRDGP